MTVSAPAAHRLTELLERIAVALERQAAPVDASETVDVKEAAALLKTTVAAIYTRRHDGKMPIPISKRPLVWRRADLLAMEDE